MCIHVSETTLQVSHLRERCNSCCNQPCVSLTNSDIVAFSITCIQNAYFSHDQTPPPPFLYAFVCIIGLTPTPNNPRCVHN